MVLLAPTSHHRPRRDRKLGHIVLHSMGGVTGEILPRSSDAEELDARGEMA